MAGTPDLFVVCKNCRAEVSPYITECPYCGHRLRKRAPKLDREAAPRRERSRRRPSTPSLGRLRANEIPGIRAPGRPYVTMAIVLISVLVTIAGRSGLINPLDFVVFTGTQGDWWRAPATVFYYGSTAYEVIVLGTIFLFGWLLERRHGWWAPLLVFTVGSAAGLAAALLVDPQAFVLGANAAALAMVGAWAVPDLQRSRRGEEIDGDLLGVAAIAVVLILLPAAVDDAHPLAGAAGGIAGLLLGHLLSGHER